MQKSPASDLYELLVTRDFEPEILDSAGKQISDPSQGEIFSFDWKTPEKNYGTVVVLLGQDNNLQVYFGDNLGRAMEGDDKQQWYQFLEQMKNFAVRNLLSFETQNLNRLKYTMQGMAAIKEGLFEGYYGNKKISYSDQPKRTRLMIRHNRDLGEGDARYRAIESLFVETADGERFKVPSRSLMHGRMLSRHIAEGGTPYDAFGQHINDIVAEMATLSRFIRAARGREFTGEAAALVESAIRHLGALKAKAKHMISQRGYRECRDQFDPASFTDSEITTEAIRDMFVQQSLDHRIEEALPVLARLAEEEAKMRETDEFECWANQVTEGTWAVPDTNEAAKKLQDLMSKPLPVGVDAMNTTEQLYDIFGDDKLFDDLSDLAEKDPNADARETIQARAEELGIPVTLTPADAEEPSADAELDEYSGAPIGGAMNMQVDEAAYVPVDIKSAKESPEIHDIPGYLNADLLPGLDRIDFPREEYSDTLYYKDPISGGVFSFYTSFGAPRIRAVNNSIDDDRMKEIAQSLSKQPTREDIDTDGVMMQRPTNCSSESVIHKELNRLLELAKI